MNSFSKILFKSFLLFLVLLWSHAAYSIVITGIYTGSCDRRLGVILGVNTYSLKFLNMAGELEDLPRHQVIQMVSFVTDEIPFSTNQIQKIPTDQVPAFKISTVKNLSEHPLVIGYPIDFTDDKIAFLTQSGRETLIDKRSILRITVSKDFVLEPHPLKRSPPKFNHAYAFAQCDKEASQGGTLINPSQILSEPLTIKRELDRIQKGFELVTRYIEEQDFYPQPVVYPSKTRLGMWYSTGSRYGSSGNRGNNYSPVLNSGYVSDVYDFQRIIVTGSQPNFLFEHEESQTQVYYAFKASYFHLAAYFDPSLFLVGANARWNVADLRSYDMKLFTTNGFGFGFDRNGWQFGFMSSAVDLAMQSGTSFYEGNVPIGKFHLVWSDFNQKLEILTGTGQITDFSNTYNSVVNISHLRLNYSRNLTEKIHTGLSYIQNATQMDFPLTPANNISAKTTSVSALIQYTFAKRFSIDSLLSVEKALTSDAEGSTSDKNYLKAGTSIHLFF